MSLDTLRPPEPDSAALSVRLQIADYLSWQRQRRRPRWILALFAAASIATVMPIVHGLVFGVDRIAEATIDRAEDAVHGRIGAEGRLAIRRQVALQATVGRYSVFPFVVTLLAVVLAGLVLSLGVVLAGEQISAAQALAVTAIASVTVSGLRVCEWLTNVGVLGRDEAVAMDWQHVSPLNFGVLAPDGAGALTLTFLSALDINALVGVALSSYAVRRIVPDMSIVASILASSGWMVIVISLKVLAALVLQFPLV
jgi:hypothetical protein